MKVGRFSRLVDCEMAHLCVFLVPDGLILRTVERNARGLSRLWWGWRNMMAAARMTEVIPRFLRTTDEDLDGLTDLSHAAADAVWEVYVENTSK